MESVAHFSTQKEACAQVSAVSAGCLILPMLKCSFRLGGAPRCLLTVGASSLYQLATAWQVLRGDAQTALAPSDCDATPRTCFRFSPVLPPHCTGSEVARGYRAPGPWARLATHPARRHCMSGEAGLAEPHQEGRHIGFCAKSRTAGLGSGQRNAESRTAIWRRRSPLTVLPCAVRSSQETYL